MYALLYATSVVAALRGLWSPCGLSMLSSLNPVAERARGHRFWVTACWYVAGSAAGGALLGGGCAAAAGALRAIGVPATARWAVVLAGAALAVLSDSSSVGWALPMHPRQLDERWLTSYRRWIYAGGFGVQIGSGFATYIMTAGTYLLALLAVVSASPAQALGAGLVFGIVRGATIAIAAVARDPAALGTLLAKVESWAGASALLALTMPSLVAAWAAGELGGAPAGLAVAASAVVIAARPLPYFQRKWTKTRPKLSESFSTRW